MQRFLGMINFYRRFLPGVAGTLRPLTAALSGNPKTLPWTPDMETAFTPPPATQLPDDLARAPTVFVRRDGHVPPLQPLYDGPYTVVCHSLHHFTLRIGKKEDKVSTLRLKPCTDPTAPPCYPGSGAACPPPSAYGISRRRGPRQEPFSPGTPPGVFARPAAVLDHTAARPARNRRAPSS
jgi:hypothetical protein